MDTEQTERISKLRAWRQAIGFSQDDCAGLAGYERSHWCRIETGKRGLTPAQKVQVARRLGARVADLFEVEDATV